MTTHGLNWPFQSQRIAGLAASCGSLLTVAKPYGETSQVVRPG